MNCKRSGFCLAISLVGAFIEKGELRYSVLLYIG